MNAAFVSDSDPLDSLTDETSSLGLLLRTDYSDEDAWQAFLRRLRDGEAEFVSETAPDTKMTEDIPVESHAAASTSTASNDNNTNDDSNDTAMGEIDDDDDGDGDGDDPDDDADSGAPQIISVIDPPSHAERARLANISNLTALRLLNDVDIAPAPAPPQGTQRIRPPNRLIDHDGWQEVYTGKTLWVYDTKSNLDQSARLVSQRAQAYGTAR